MIIDTADSPRNAARLADRILVSEDESSIALGVSKPTFRQWVADGLITPVALPDGMRRKLYRRTDLEAFAASLAASR
jgi:DNA-binding transcriptional MerR regulator